jgi:hypothetical protein
MVGSPFRATMRTVTYTSRTSIPSNTGDGQTCNRADVSRELFQVASVHQAPSRIVELFPRRATVAR